jgi:DDB1- and CUL4-associated factor 7
MARPDPFSQFRLAIGSFVKKYSNAVQVVKKLNGGDSYDNQLFQACEFEHPYPCTKILWSTDVHSVGGKDLLATTGDYLRLWNITDDGRGQGTLIPKKEALLNNVRNSFCLFVDTFGLDFTL